MPVKTRRTFAALAAVASLAVMGAVTYADADSPRFTDAEAAAGLRRKLRSQEIEREVHEEAFRRAGGTVATIPTHLEALELKTCPTPSVPNEVRAASLADLPSEGRPGGLKPPDLPTEVLHFSSGATPAGHVWFMITGWRGAPRRSTAIISVRPISSCGGVADDYSLDEEPIDLRSEAALEVEGIDGATVTMKTADSTGNPCTIRIDLDLGRVDDPCRLVISGLPSDGSLRR